MHCQVEVEIRKRGNPPVRALVRVHYVGPRPSRETVEFALNKVFRPLRLRIVAWDVDTFVSKPMLKLLKGRSRATS